MTLSEFSTEFDVLYNNITSNQAPSLDDYEKSVFLTKGQLEVIKAYFTPIANKSISGYDDSPIRQYDFSSLTKTVFLTMVKDASNKIDKRSKVFILPHDYFISVNEIVESGNQIFSVIPLQYEEYQRLMMKPYSFPVKRAVWRLINNKRACNYIKEYIDDGNGNLTKCNYSILTSWADQQRNLRITIKMFNYWDPLDEHDDYITIEDSTIYFPVTTVAGVNYAKVSADCGWLENKLTYKTKLWVYIDNTSAAEDAVAFKIIKEGFQRLKDKLGDKIYTKDTEITNAAVHLDLFEQSEAPSGFKNTMAGDGLELTTQVIPVPQVEIIGKVDNELVYSMRYIKRPGPIILTDISNTDNSIEGISRATECELPVELHHEILQRAVELAKASYTGDLVSQVSLGQNSETNMGITQQQR